MLERLETLEELDALEKTCSAEFALLKQRGFRCGWTAIFRGATEVDVGLFGDFASTRGSADKAFFDEEGFIDLFHGASVFSNSGGDGADAHRSTLEFVADGEQICRC